MYAWGTAMGQEQRGKGANVLLGPDISVLFQQQIKTKNTKQRIDDTQDIARVPMGGRIFEMFSEDPVLTAKLNHRKHHWHSIPRSHSYCEALHW